MLHSDVPGRWASFRAENGAGIKDRGRQACPLRSRFHSGIADAHPPVSQVFWPFSAVYDHGQSSTGLARGSIFNMISIFPTAFPANPSNHFL